MTNREAMCRVFDGDCARDGPCTVCDRERDQASETQIVLCVCDRPRGRGPYVTETVSR